MLWYLLVQLAGPKSKINNIMVCDHLLCCYLQNINNYKFILYNIYMYVYNI